VDLISVHFFVCPKKQPVPSEAEGNQRKGTFSKGFFMSFVHENHSDPAKFSPGLQKFLTPVHYYPAEKDGLGKRAGSNQ